MNWICCIEPLLKTKIKGITFKFSDSTEARIEKTRELLVLRIKIISGYTGTGTILLFVKLQVNIFCKFD